MDDLQWSQHESDGDVDSGFGQRESDGDVDSDFGHEFGAFAWEIALDSNGWFDKNMMFDQH